MPALTDALANDLPTHRGRVVPSSFNADDPALGALPLPEQYTWRSAAEALITLGSIGTMIRLPLFWQTELLLHDACRAANTYLFVNDRANMPVGALALKANIVDTVVTDVNDMSAFVTHVLDAHIALPAKWLIVRSPERAREPITLRPKKATIVQEVHLVPGVPLLSQCRVLARSEQLHFHTTGLAELTRNGICRVIETDLWPLHDYELPFSIHTSGICDCGKEVLAIS